MSVSIDLMLTMQFGMRISMDIVNDKILDRASIDSYRRQPLVIEILYSIHIHYPNNKLLNFIQVLKHSVTGSRTEKGSIDRHDQRQ